MKLQSAIALALIGLSAMGSAARSETAASVKALPPATKVIYAAGRHMLEAGVSTNQRGRKEMVVYANVPQTLRLSWHVNAGGQMEIATRPAWNPNGTWTPVERLRPTETLKGRREVTVSEPTAVRLRVRGPAWPQSGIARTCIRYERATAAVLRGEARAEGRPVVVLEGVDLLDNLEANDPAWDSSGKLAELVRQGREQHGLDPWLLDWGHSGLPLETLAGELSEVLRQVRARNGNRRESALLGISMGAIVARETLVSARHGGEELGVRKFVSLNGPHRGARLNPELLRFFKKYGPGSDQPEALRSSTWVSPFERPSVRQLLSGTDESRQYFDRLRSRGSGGYDPAVENVAFSNGPLHAEPLEKEGFTIQRATARPFWLPFRLPAGTIRAEAADAVPGDLLLTDAFPLTTRMHFRVASAVRFDVQSRFHRSPTFVPTRSALDLPNDRDGGNEGCAGEQAGKSPFVRVYAATKPCAHLDLDACWAPAGDFALPPGQGSLLLRELATR